MAMTHQREGLIWISRPISLYYQQWHVTCQCIRSYSVLQRVLVDPKILHCLSTILPNLDIFYYFLGSSQKPIQPMSSGGGRGHRLQQVGFPSLSSLFPVSGSQLDHLGLGFRLQNSGRVRRARMGFFFFTSRAAARFLDGIGRPGVSTAALLLTAARCGCLLIAFDKKSA